MIYLFLILSILFASPAWAISTTPTDTFREVLMQNAAVATGNGTSVAVDYFTTISVQVTITGTATITWEESINGASWNTGTCVLSSAPGALLTTATATGLYHCNLSALTQFRARISSYASGTVTAYARITQFDFQNILTPTSGAGGDGAIVDGVSGAIRATVFDYTNSNPLAVVLRDTNGDYVSVGGGTQYTQGTATTDTDTLTMMGCVRSDTAGVATGVVDQDRARCIVDSTGRIWAHIGAIDGGTITTITNPVAVTQSGAWSLSANQSVNVAQINGTTIDTNVGTASAGTQRTVIASNQPQIPVLESQLEALLGTKGDAPASTLGPASIIALLKTHNLELMQLLSGVKITNLPTTQPVSGTVMVSNFPTSTVSITQGQIGFTLPPCNPIRRTQCQSQGTSYSVSGF